MAWYWWLVCVLGFLLSLSIVYIQGYRSGAKEARLHSQMLGSWLERWVRINNKFVSEVTHASIEGEPDQRARNVRLLYENRHLKKKVVRLAFKYGKASKDLKEAPMRDHIHTWVSVMDRISAATLDEEKRR